MSSQRESIAQSIRSEPEALIDAVSNVADKQPSVHETEEQLWASMLALGRGLMQLRFEALAEAEKVQKVIDVQGVSYDYQRRSQRAYVSLFGEVQVKRAYYLNEAGKGVCPLDTVLSLPARRYSDSVQERLSEVNVWVAQEHSLALVERWLGLKIPKGSLQSSVADQAAYVEAYYQQQPTSITPEGDSLLVATADGKGIPMTRADSPAMSARSRAASPVLRRRQRLPIHPQTPQRRQLPIQQHTP